MKSKGDGGDSIAVIHSEIKPVTMKTTNNGSNSSVWHWAVPYTFAIAIV